METCDAKARSRVLIAGAGPVGLAAALRLAQLGVPALVLERRMELARGLKACAWLPPTLALFERLGVLDGLMATGLVAQRIAYARARAHPAPGEGDCEEIACFDLALLADEARFPYRLHLDHGPVAAALAARLAAYPQVQFALDAELVGFEQTESGVAVRVLSATGERIERGAFLIAADGADSAVRTRLGVRLCEAALPGRWLEVLTEEDLSRTLPGAAWAGWIAAAPAGDSPCDAGCDSGCDSSGGSWCSLLRMPGVWHVAMPLAPGEDAAAALEEGALRARLARFLPGFPGGAPQERAAGLALVGSRVLPLRREIAERFVVGRVLLVGDAAHQVQTRVGLNMNCAMRDAVAAAEAVAAVLAGEQGVESGLAGYESARRGVAMQRLLPLAGCILPDSSPTRGPAWEAGLRAIAADPARTRTWLRETALFDLPGTQD